MFRFLGQKIKNRKWLMLCLFIGNLLLISTLCCISMYSDAIQSRVLERKMNASMDKVHEYPMLLRLTATLTVVTADRHTGAEFLEMKAKADELGSGSNANIKEAVEIYSVSSKATTDILRDDRKYTVGIQIAKMSDIEKHIRFVDGVGYDTVNVTDGVYPVVVSEKFMASQKLVLDEILTMNKLKDKSGEKLRVKVVGVFTSTDKNDEYWVNQPGSYDNVMFMAGSNFDDLFVNFQAPEIDIRGYWYILFDYNNTTKKQMEYVATATKDVEALAEQQSALSATDKYMDILEDFLTEDNQTGKMLWILQAPILVLLLAFIMMVSRQTLSLETGEIAVLKSRGASRMQIILLYVMQSLILGLAACIPGILLGALLCQVLGSANAFMEFVGRSALRIRFFRPQILIDCLGAVFVATLATVLPVIKFSAGTTVSNRQKRRGKRTGIPFWQKFGLDFVLLALGLYGWYSFRGSEEALSEQVLAGQNVNVFLYFSSAVFMVGAGLVITRIIHLIPKLIYLVFGKHMGPAGYAAFTRIMRSGREQNFIIVFLIMTISLGIFNADTARTINANDENNVKFKAGTDIVLKEYWSDNSALVALDKSGGITRKYSEPDISKYKDIEGVEAVARVYNSFAVTSYGRYDVEFQMLAIDTKEFGETAYMPDGILESHWFNMLNDMNAVPSGVIISKSLGETTGLREGDEFFYSLDGTLVKGKVTGITEYFPSIQPKSVFHNDWNNQDYVYYTMYMIANLAYVQTATGVNPYEVWIRTDGDTSGVYDLIDNSDIYLVQFNDACQTITDHKNDARLQGTNGMLTVGFLIVLLLCIIGFLIFWILSIKQRTLQLGVFRAMGVVMGEIIHMLIDEQIFITGLSVICGAVIGKITSKLYIPLIQIAYKRADSVLPLQVISDTSDTVRILVMMGVIIVACIITLGIYISRTGIAQALKLGEDN